MTTTTGKQTLHASHGRNRVRRQPKDVAFDVVLYLICAVLLILILYPLWFIVIASFSDPSAVAGGHVWFVPVGFTLDGYEELLNQPNVWVGYRNTILYTVVGTLVGLAVNIPAAYALSRRDLWGRKALMGLFVFTMFFSGGLIPGYLVVQQVGLGDSIWCMILPVLVGQFNIILIKNYVEDLPASIEESARIDGANDMVILFKIILPMSTPIIATVALFIAVDRWNEYWFAMLHIIDKAKQPLQLLLRNVLMDTTHAMTGAAAAIASQERKVYDQSLQMAIVTIATVPILLVYPFVQKYFTKGIMLGGVKG